MSSDRTLLVVGGGRLGSLPPSRPASSARRLPCLKIGRTLGIGRFPQVWSYLGPED